MNQRPLLLVEDDENDIFFFERAMTEARPNHPLEIVRDGREAVEYLSKRGGTPNGSQSAFPCLVVLDLNLPYRNGLDVLKWIRSAGANPAVPVVVLTSSMADPDMREAYRLGANSFLIKPSHPHQLADILRAVTSYWFDLNKAPEPSAEGNKG